MYWYIMQLWWLDVTTLDLSSANGTMAEWSKALESGDLPYLVRKGASSNLARVRILCSCRNILFVYAHSTNDCSLIPNIGAIARLAQW